MQHPHFLVNLHFLLFDLMTLLTNLLLLQNNRTQMKVALVVLVSKILFFCCFALTTNLLNLRSSQTKENHLLIDLFLDLGQLCNKCDP